MKKSKPSRSVKSRKLKLSEIPTVYQDLLAHFGHQSWWPGETDFEIMVGTILTQNTAWTNVEKAIANLKKAKVLEPRKMSALTPSKLARLIRPAGYFNVKAKRLKAFLHFLAARYDFKIEAMKRQDGRKLRRQLLDVNGIGPETADSILLYALDKPFFVIDAYTKRIFSRHGLAPFDQSYDDWQKLFESGIRRAGTLRPRVLMDMRNDFHAQIVMVGKHHCKPTPRCQGCPLEPYL